MGNGRDINFLTHHWVFIPENQRKFIDWNLKVSDFIDKKCWDQNKLRQVLSDEVVKKICNVTIPRSNTDDKII